MLGEHTICFMTYSDLNNETFLVHIFAYSDINPVFSILRVYFTILIAYFSAYFDVLLDIF